MVLELGNADRLGANTRRRGSLAFDCTEAAQSIRDDVQDGQGWVEAMHLTLERSPLSSSLKKDKDMALSDDLKTLADEDVLYLTWTLSPVVEESLPNPGPPSPVLVYRGRLRQAISGNWIFDSSTGASGATGLLLGTENISWTSAESPASGLQVTIAWPLDAPTGVELTMQQVVVIGTVIPADLAT